MSAIRCLRKLKYLLMGTLKTALTYGEPEVTVIHLDIGDKPSGSEPIVSKTSTTSYNGVVSSLEFFTFVVTISSVTTLSSYMSDKMSDSTAAQLVLFVLMCCGLVIMFLFGMFHDDVLMLEGRRRNRVVPLRDRLNLIGIILFYIFACVLDMFYSLALLDCGVHWSMCPSDVISYYVVSSLFHIARVIYMGAETLFCIVFHGATFTGKSLVRYGLMLLQAVNVALWFDVLLQESVDRVHTHKMFNVTDECLISEANASQHSIDCFHQNTTSYRLLQNYVCPNFYPFSIEFSLLVGDCLAGWFVQSGKAEAPEVLDEQDEPLLDPGDSSSGEHSVTSVCHDGRQAVDVSPLLPSQQSPPTSGLIASKIFLLVSLVLSLLFCILSMLPKLMKQSSDPYKRVFLIYGIFYFFCHLILIVCGYCISINFRPKKWRPLEGLEYLLIVSAIGPFAYEFFSFVAIINLGNQMSAAAFEETYTIAQGVFVVLELIHTIEIYLQIPFQLYVSRVDFGTSNPRSAKRIYLKVILFHFAASNIGLWAVNSFTGTYNVRKVFVQSSYFGESKWLAMNNIVLPLTLFFRFTSFLHFTRAYSTA